MKRFLLFGESRYYPLGGWSDFQGAFESLESAQAAASPDWDWAHVVDTETMTIVASVDLEYLDIEPLAWKVGPGAYRPV